MAYPIGMICRASITVGGVTIYAKDYGKRAFCFFPKGETKELQLATVAPRRNVKTKPVLK